MDAFVRQLEQCAVEGQVAALLAKVKEIVPSYAGHLRDGQPWVLQLDGEPRKPLAAAQNGTITSLDRGWLDKPA